ncbi:DegT/DnrJ/EryC1/StrS family aminotransferase [Paenibacillus albicereus]|uniref:DegT/DnrJ/EryC1/StrS family aminotransferase n=1 Tax=Paenibacillus albicereus TaxID=2726185 RepID=A0A6H2H1N3_9BACL|nr:DegT/DnrJ/EryC1/StrS family aminotransferase [Paenibacillus albicereus]QJC53258.1 DegT/DnrJ/EryC1/StrS family aminotransferase [Paenibacillus albicereus]
MGILFSAPQAEYDIIREQWLADVAQIGRQGVFVGGARVSKFESAWASYLDAGAAIGVGNGTDALFLALKALGIGPGDEVITAANTFVATASAIHHTGATPVLVDCSDGYLMDLADVRAAVTARTRAVIPVHLYGQLIDLAEWKAWSEERGIALVEDCAQAAGASLRGKAAGSWGVMGCFSFYPDKNLGALGDGGAVVTSSPEMAGRLRKLRNHGGEARYQHELPGFNSRLDPIQASALHCKLAYLDEWNAHRRSAAGWYRSHLAGVSELTLPGPVEPDDSSHVFHLYVVRVGGGRRDELRRQLQKKGILTAVQYPVPVHLLPAYAGLGYGPGSFPRAERYAAEILSLPMHAALQERDVAAIGAEIQSFFAASPVPGRS